MIVGDEFVTTRQESVYAAITQEPEMHGPPMYYTPDWASARQSVRRLARLQPELIVTGHGRAMRGPQMRSALDRLATDFDQIAVPKHGRYIESARGAWATQPENTSKWQSAGSGSGKSGFSSALAIAPRQARPPVRNC
jgi:hypothetical protein